MKRMVWSIWLICSVTFADSVLLVKEGWQLIGSATPMEDMSAFSAQSVEQVWHFDASSQSWLGYSPDANISQKMQQKGIKPLGSLQSWHGFWVKSKQEWALTFPNKEILPSANDTIALKKGWNLVSLPVDTVVLANIFEGMSVWKYTNDGAWELFDNDANESFAPIGHIKNSDGFWVKAATDTNISVMHEASKLHNFTSNEAMQSYLEEMISLNARPVCGIETLSLAVPESAQNSNSSMASSATETTNASETNVQEAGVDEADILKHNNHYVFYSSENRGEIYVTTFEALAQNISKPLRSIGFESERRIDSFYLVDERLVVLSYENFYSSIDVDYFKPQESTLIIDTFDISDINNTQNIASLRVDGSLISSRVLNNTLYLISSFFPRYSINYPQVEVNLSQECQLYLDKPYIAYEESAQHYATCYNIYKDGEGGYYRYDYDNPTLNIAQLTPQIDDNGTMHKLISPTRLFASNKPKQYPTLTTITQIDTQSGRYEQSSAFVGSSQIQYASNNALYLVSNEYPLYYDFSNYKTRSTIYRFNLDALLSYEGVGAVYGHTLNQFALSEHENILRIATTQSENGTTNNTLYTLEPKNGLLEIQGLLSGLGKEGETIKSVRFMGDKGYIVTYRTTDPLYTLDLSDATNPKKVGELHVDGYSAYLHPIGQEYLLGIGQDADASGRRQGVKIELFDIQDFANPRSLSALTLGENTHSELDYNHKALAYRASDHLFAFPISTYSAYDSLNYLGIYQVKDGALISYAPLSTTQWGEHRGLIFDHNEESFVSFFANGEVNTKKITKE